MIDKLSDNSLADIEPQHTQLLQSNTVYTVRILNSKLSYHCPISDWSPHLVIIAQYLTGPPT